jgi:hypothetical protein
VLREFLEGTGFASARILIRRKQALHGVRSNPRRAKFMPERGVSSDLSARHLDASTPPDRISQGSPLYPLH